MYEIKIIVKFLHPLRHLKVITCTSFKMLIRFIKIVKKLYFLAGSFIELVAVKTLLVETLIPIKCMVIGKIIFSIISNDLACGPL